MLRASLLAIVTVLLPPETAAYATRSIEAIPVIAATNAVIDAASVDPMVTATCPVATVPVVVNSNTSTTLPMVTVAVSPAIGFVPKTNCEPWMMCTRAVSASSWNATIPRHGYASLTALANREAVVSGNAEASAPPEKLFAVIVLPL